MCALGGTVVLAGCGGGAAVPASPAAAQPARATAAPATAANDADAAPGPVTVALTYTLAPNQQSALAPAANGRRLAYVSTSNVSFSVVVTPIGGAPSAPYTGSCTTVVCSITFTASPGPNTLAITLTDAVGGTGNVLSAFSTTVIVDPVVQNTLALTANPVVDHVVLQPAVASVSAAAASDTVLSVKAMDKDNKLIAGSGNYVDAGGVPLGLTLAVAQAADGGNGTMTLKGPVRITAPGQAAIVVHYDGRWYDQATISVSSSRAVAGALTGATLSSLAKITEFTIPTGGSSPHGICTGSDGNIWLTEGTGNKISHITPGGAFAEYSIPTAGGNPYRITAGADGNLWFTEDSQNKIGKVTPAGAFNEYTVPTGGSTPYGITAGPDGNVWFTESSGNKIGRITPAGTINEFTVPTGGSSLQGITGGPDGNVWFVENGGNKIGRITPQGAITEFSLPTGGSGPAGIVTGPDHNLWFTQGSGNRIGVVTPAGVFSQYTVPTGGSSPKEIVTGPDGKLWFTENTGNKIGSITTGGAFAEYTVPTGGSGPTGIAVGSDGNIWISENSSNKMARLIL